MNVFREQTTKQLLAKLMICVIFTAMCLFLSPMLLPGNQAEVLAAEPFDSLAVQAVSNNYNLYKTGTVVDGSWGKFGAVDGYVLTSMGVKLEHWQNGDTNFREELLALIDTTLVKENGDSSSSAKQVVYEYLLAKEWGETEKAGQLLTLLKERQNKQGNGSFDNDAFSDLSALAVLGRAGVLAEFDQAKAITFILDSQNKSSGAWTTGWQDFQTTAQAVRALTYLKPFVADKEGELAAVQEAIDKGLAWLKDKQQSDGSFLDDAGFDDPLIDTVEVLLTLKTVGIEFTDKNWVSSEGKSVVDYLTEKALNEDGTFGTSRNLADNTWTLKAFNCLGASIAEDAVIGLSLTPENIELAVGEEQEFTATAFLVNGTTVDVTTTAAWSVNAPEIASIDTDGKVVVKRITEGYFQVRVSYQVLSRTSVVPPVNITVRIEGPEYTILPDTVITVPAGSGYLEVLRAGQSLHNYLIEGEGYVEKINGLGTPDFYWMAAPYQAVYQDGEVFVMSGNGSGNWGELVLSTSEVKPGATITVTVTNHSGEPVEGAKVIYYTLERQTTATTAGYTDANGQLKFSIGEKGTYFVAADKPNTVDYPEDNGLVRTVAQELLVKASSSGGGGGSSRPPVSEVRVEVTVTGENGERLFSGRVNLEQKQATVFDTLAKTGLSYEGDSYFITAIEGQKNRGMNGWMVKVNGKFIATSIGDYTLRTGDTVQWVYSTESDNIVGIGEKKGDTTSSAKKEIAKSAEETLNDLLNRGEELKVNLENTVNQQASFSPQFLAKVAEQGQGFQLESEKVQVSFAPSSLLTEQLSKVCEEEKTLLNFGAKVLENKEKKKIVETALKEGCGLDDIGAQVVELKAEIVRTEEKGEVHTETITGFHEPVQVTLDLSGLKLAEEDFALLTAVRYEKDRWGNLQAVKLGGTYNVTSGKFTFYTENFSLYSVVRAKELLTIALVIDEPEVLVNNKKKNVDVPACLIENRTMVPLRFVAEAMGAEVQWKEEMGMVEIYMQDKLLKLVVGKTGPDIEVPATIKQGRTLVPLRYVVKHLGATITWFPSTQMVMVVK